MLDAHQMNVFLTAAETRNFTAAARLLNMTQPSVSQHIQALEDHFQTTLFIRKGRKMILSDAGEALLPMARRMVDWSVQIDETMESLHGEVYGHLKVGCSTTSGKYILPILLTSFMKIHPKVTATCQVTSRIQAVNDLNNGLIHLALASPREFTDQVEYRRLIADPIRLIVPLTHPWAGRDEINPDELLEADFIMREEGSGTFEVAGEGLEQAGIHVDRLRRTLILGNSEAIALAVEEGLGVGFVSQIVITRLVSNRVATVNIRGVNMRQEVCIGRNKTLPGTNAQNAFWDFVTDGQNPTVRKLLDNGRSGSPT